MSGPHSLGRGRADPALTISLPAPGSLADYQAIIPDAPERFMRQWEMQAAHRRRMEMYLLQWNVRLSLLGLICGATFAILFLAASVALILAGHELGGAALGASDIAGLVIALVAGRRSGMAERLKRAQIFAGASPAEPEAAQRRAE